MNHTMHETEGGVQCKTCGIAVPICEFCMMERAIGEFPIEHRNRWLCEHCALDAILEALEREA